MKEIPLTNGKSAQVDDDMYEYLMQWKWRAQKSETGRWYATAYDSAAVNNFGEYASTNFPQERM